MATSSVPLAPSPAPGVSVPRLHRVVRRRRESFDVVSLELAATDSSRMSFRPGQFNMLSVTGVGEVAVSVSDAPRPYQLQHHTIRDVGAVSHALCASDVGDVIGVRGPFGSHWRVPERTVDVDDALVIVAGGVGLAPLRGAINQVTSLLEGAPGRIFVLVGARDPDQILFKNDLAAWAHLGAHVDVTVDHAGRGWRGHVGLVTTLIGRAHFDPARARALICGPEIMMRQSARTLLAKGVASESILVSLERNMQCATGWCGHCQLGPLLLCRDGPVVAFDPALSDLLSQEER